MDRSGEELSRRAFELALQAELAEVLQDFKARAAAAQTPGDIAAAVASKRKIRAESRGHFPAPGTE
jgi:hypothetical protein